jgi:hypothetical protein
MILYQESCRAGKQADKGRKKMDNQGCFLTSSSANSESIRIYKEDFI